MRSTLRFIMPFHHLLISAPHASVTPIVGRVLGEGDRIRFTCTELHRELFGELRWTAAEAEHTRDGIDVATLELSHAETAALRLLARPDVSVLLRRQGTGAAIAEIARDAIGAASAVGLLSLAGDKPVDWLNGGRAMQRVWLAATSLGLVVQPMTVLLYMFEMMGDASGVVYTDPSARSLRLPVERVLQSGLPPGT